MLRSKSLLSADHDHTTSFSFSNHNQHAYGRLFCLVALGAFITSSSIVLGQNEVSTSNVQQTTSQAPQICDGQNQSESRKLSLALHKQKSADDETEVAEQQSLAQDDSEMQSAAAKFPEVKNPTSDAQDQVLLCRKKKTGSATETVRPIDPSPASNQVADQEQITVAPIVSYSNGNLTINAKNTRMRDVLEAIRVHAGISVDFPPGSMNERIFDQVGPAPLRDALTKLLYGSGFNYVIQTSSQDPQIVTKLVLTAQSHQLASGTGKQTSLPVADQADNQALYGGVGNNADTPAVPVQPVQNPNAIGIPVGFDVQKAAAASGKTPGQILDELQKQQQQVLDAQTPQQ